MSTISAPPAYSLLDLEAHDPKAKGGGRERIFKCPVCGGSERSLHLNTQTGLWNCKRASCGSRGKLTDFWEQTQPQPAKVRARAALQKTFALPATAVASPEISDQSKQIDEVTSWSWQWENSVCVSESDFAQEALEARGLDLVNAIEAGVRFCTNWAPSTEGKRYFGGNAILYPMRAPDGQLHAVAGRYLHPKSSGHKARVGGSLRQGAFFAPVNGIKPLDQANPFIFLVEGPACALSLAACGVPAIAVGGCNLSEFLPIRCGLRNVVIGSDCDAAGDKAASDWAEQLERLGAKCIRLRADEVAHEAKDWNDALQMVGVDGLCEFLIELHVLVQGVGSVTPLSPNRKTNNSLAQEVRERSALYWESRRVEVEAVGRKSREKSGKIDWIQIEQDRAMQDALSVKLGPLKAIQAIFRATNEILSLWTPKGRKESPEALQRAALELLCMRHEIPFDNMFDSEMATNESNAETEITAETEFEGWYRLSEENFPTEDDYFETATVIDGQLLSLGNAFIRASTGKAWMHESMHVELEWEFTHWRYYEDDNEPIQSATDRELKSIQTPIVTSRGQGNSRRRSDADIMREIVEVCTNAKREIAATAEASNTGTSNTDNSNPPSTLSLELEMFGDNKK